MHQVVKYVPQVFHIETVMGCNAKCIMCRITDTERTAKIMSDDLFEKIAVEIASYGTSPEVSLQLLGEPLIDKKLERRIWTLKELGVHNVGFATNGQLMTATRAESILAVEPHYVRFSLEAHTKETFEKIRVGLDFDIVTANIINFFKTRDRLGSQTSTNLLFIRHDDNIEELEPYLMFWRDYIKGTDSIEVVDRHNFGNGDFSTVTSSDKPCYIPNETMVIFADGEVSLCCGDADGEFKMGNVIEDSLLDVFNNQRFHRFRAIQNMGARDMLKLCSTCNIPEALASAVSWRMDTSGTSNQSAEAARSAIR
jgi:radical SAM protein with 4Fe4S-binding SPASM domain